MELVQQVSFDVLFEFEQALAEYTGSPYAVVTDCCTHAIELCMRLDHITVTSFSAYTYLSIPQLMHRLKIDYQLLDESWIGEYRFYGTNTWDSARRLEREMYRPGMRQCLSFGNGKPLQLGRCGAILLDNKNDYNTLSRLRSDGRDLQQTLWQDYPVTQGYHYCPTLETCALGIKKLSLVNEQPKYHQYPDTRNLTWDPPQ